MADADFGSRTKYTDYSGMEVESKARMRNYGPMETFYRHFKGNIYRFAGIAKDSETLEEMVVYQAMYGGRPDVIPTEGDVLRRNCPGRETHAPFPGTLPEGSSGPGAGRCQWDEGVAVLVGVPAESGCAEVVGY